MSVFVDHIPSGAPVIIALVVMPGCGACEEYEPRFLQVAESYARRGLPIIKIDAMTEDPNTIAFMNKHAVNATPTVVAATLYRGPLAKIEGTATVSETRALFETAWAHNRR